MALLLLLALSQDLAPELPRLKPTEPADALKTFTLAAGVTLELVAHEPAVVDPVDMAFDEEGRLWVVEMIDYPHGDAEGNPPQGRVKRLEDVDGDGRFERAVVIAERLRWPTGLCLWDGGAFVISTPDLLYVKEGVREVVFTGFGDQNVQALANNPRWGPDLWIYASSGGNGGVVRSKRKPDAPPVNLRGRDFRFRPSGEIEACSGGGQFGHSMDPYGRRFVCSNSVQARHVVLEDRYLALNPAYAVPAVTGSIAADGDAGPVFRLSPPEPWRIVRTRMRASGEVAGIVEPLTGFFTSATGVFWHKGRLYVGDVANNLVHRKALEADGSSFRATRIDAGGELVASSDNWFRPANFATGPDGALYICDVYRECIEHPKSIPESIKKHLDLSSGKDRGRIWRVREADTPAWRRPSLRTPEERAAALSSPHAWWRETALRLVCEKGEGRLLPPTAVAAREALGVLGEEDVAAALKSDDPGVREQAVLRAPLEAALALDDPHPRVRLMQAWRLAGTPDPRAKAVFERLKQGSDKWLRWAVAVASGEKSVAMKVTGGTTAASTDRTAALKAFQPALALRGDGARGRETYRKTCLQCHKSGAEGFEVGPDLATVKARTPEELLVHILDPNREVNPQWASVRIRTTSGDVVDGLLAAETATSVTLKRPKGEILTLLKTQIDKLAPSSVSLMPEGLEKGLTPQDLADLIQFLRE